MPTLTGGVGHDQLKRFYKYHFIGGNPPDTGMTPVSRTVGADQIVDEMIFSFTHTSEIDWMLPGIAPTGRKVEVPLVAIVKFEDGKVAHEHIYWDQASVLVQIGKLDPDGPAGGGRRERRQGARQQPALQRADAALGGERGQADLGRHRSRRKQLDDVIPRPKAEGPLKRPQRSLAAARDDTGDIEAPAELLMTKIGR